MITLDASSDSGSLNNDQITNDNNSNNNPPLFDITNIEPNDIVNLYRTPGTVNAQGAVHGERAGGARQHPDARR